MTVQMVGLNCLYINITFYIPFEFYVDEHITLMTAFVGRVETRSPGPRPPDGCLLLHEIKTWLSFTTMLWRQINIAG